MRRSDAGRPAVGSVVRRTLVALALAADLAACGGGTAPAPTAPAAPAAATGTTSTPTTVPPSSRLNVSALEFQYDAGGPVNLAAGAVTITLRNQGAEPHHGQLMRLRDGVTSDDIAAAIADDPSAAPLLDLGEQVGGPGIVSPGGTSRVTEQLAAGSYLMFCLVRAPSGETHAIDGMVAQFKVSPQKAAGSIPRPTADLRLTDSGFRLPSPFPRHGVLRVSNQGKRPHEVTFLELPRGRGLEAIQPYLRALRSTPLLQPPPPLDAAGGVAAIAPGGTATVPVDLKPGSYVAICLVRGPDGQPHALHGMVQVFTVR